MTDYSSQRRQMVDTQLRTFDVTHRRVIDAFDDVPREKLVPSDQETLAYCDKPLLLGHEGRTLLTPMVLARLIQSLLLSLPSDKPFKVLNIAGGAGYGAALLSHVGANVIFLEEMQDLADQALQNLSRAGYASHVICVHGDFAQGVIQHAPFDAILIEGVFAQLPDTLIQQLREGGILVGLEGVNAAPKAMLYTKSTQHMSGRALFSAHGAMLKAFAPVENFAF